MEARRSSVSVFAGVQDLLGIEGMSREDLREIIEVAKSFEDGHFEKSLTGKTVCLAFFESSTRTLVSFDLAARRSGANVISLSEKGSSISKGESLADTIVTLDMLGADAIVLRHSSAGAARLAASNTSAAVINAGDGCGQHPTQALLDLYALSEARGGFDALESTKAVIAGDILHSRVARSVIPAFRKAGVEVALCAPATLLPMESDAWGLPILGSVDEAVEWGADTLYMLRLQNERMTGARVPSVSEYAKYYGVSRRHLDASPDMLVMHPGPVNRGVEIAGDVVMDSASLVGDQIAAGVWVRSAVLALATGAVERTFA